MFRRYLRDRVRATIDALEHLVGGLGTSVLALGVLLWLLVVAVACLGGVGLLLVDSALQAVRSVADRERARLSRWGPAVIGAPPLPEGLRAAVRDRGTRREVGWVLTHGTFGFGLGILGISLALYAVQDTTYPLWWWAMPAGSTAPGVGLWPV